MAVEYFDSDGAGYITTFAGQQAEARVKDYHDAIVKVDFVRAPSKRGANAMQETCPKRN